MARLLNTVHKDDTMEQQHTQALLNQVVMTAEEFDTVVSVALPTLLDRATSYIKRVLRETGQWNDDVEHEKFILRWGAECIERFLACGRHEVPCRPLFLLDFLVARQHSQPEPFCYYPDLLLTPFGRLIDGLLARAVINRDALIALYRHTYGLAPGDVIGILGMGPVESQRIYKNFQRWRDVGWQRAIDQIGITQLELSELERRQAAYPDRFNDEAARLVRSAQTHYRKSEPDHYPCLAPGQWIEMFEQGYGSEYRTWHLALCIDCFRITWDLNGFGASVIEKPRVNFQVRP